MRMSHTDRQSVRAHNPITKLSKGKNPITGNGRMIIKEKITYTNIY